MFQSIDCIHTRTYHPVTVNGDLDLDHRMLPRVRLNQSAKYLDERSNYCPDTHSGPTALPGPLKWSVINHCIIDTYTTSGQYAGCARRLPVCTWVGICQFSTSEYGTAPRVISSQRSTPNDHYRRTVLSTSVST